MKTVEKNNKNTELKGKKKLKFPKKGELIATSKLLCGHCKYSVTIGGGPTNTICDYYLMTKNMRGCKCGECDKFEKLEGRKQHKLSPYW